MTKTGPVPQDLTGRAFGKWTVLSLYSNRNRTRKWLCRCECGTERPVFGFSLSTGKSMGCGCPENLTGQRFGRWVVIGRHSKRKSNRNQRWLCRCDCNTERDVFGPNLKNGCSASCGCTIGPATKRRRTKHGRTDSKLYAVWASMRQRCNNPNTKNYYNYGGRGITVSYDWETFEGFLSDMESTYVEGLTLDRIDVNGNYGPGNCIWVPRSEQSKNRRPYSEWRRRDKISPNAGSL